MIKHRTFAGVSTRFNLPKLFLHAVYGVWISRTTRSYVGWVIAGMPQFRTSLDDYSQITVRLVGSE